FYMRRRRTLDRYETRAPDSLEGSSKRCRLGPGSCAPKSSVKCAHRSTSAVTPWHTGRNPQQAKTDGASEASWPYNADGRCSPVSEAKLWTYTGMRGTHGRHAGGFGSLYIQGARDYTELMLARCARSTRSLQNICRRWCVSVCT